MNFSSFRTSYWASFQNCLHASMIPLRYWSNDFSLRFVTLIIQLRYWLDLVCSYHKKATIMLNQEEAKLQHSCSILCCPLWIKRKQERAQKMLKSETERLHLHNGILVTAKYSYMWKCKAAVTLDKLWQINVNKNNSSFIAKAVTKISVCSESHICNNKVYSRHAQISVIRI